MTVVASKEPAPFHVAVGACAGVFFVVLAGCDVSNPKPPETEQEVITTVRLTFTPAGGGASVVAAHADPENDGDPVIDAIVLDDGVSYTLAVAFENELEDPAEDITVEVADEAEDHQVLVYGDAVSGPASAATQGTIVTHTYNDDDDNGLPVGLDNTIVGDAVGTGTFRVMLRHLPPQNDVAVKDDSIAATFAAEGSAGIAGDVDADVAFNLTVQ